MPIATPMTTGFIEKYVAAPLRFSLEAIKYGWDVFKAKPGFFIGLIVALGLLTGIPDYILGKTLNTSSTVYKILEVAVRLIGLFFGMVTTRVSLDLYDLGEADLSKSGELAKSYLSYFLGKLLYAVVIASPFLVPFILYFIFKESLAWLTGLSLIAALYFMIVLSYKFLYVGYFIIDRKLGPIDALKESSNAITGSKWTIFIFSLAIAILNILGAMVLMVGLLVTIPMTLMASVYVYRQLSPRLEAEAV
jgi:hypothetical protein